MTQLITTDKIDTTKAPDGVTYFHWTVQTSSKTCTAKVVVNEIGETGFTGADGVFYPNGTVFTGKCEWNQPTSTEEAVEAMGEEKCLKLIIQAMRADCQNTGEYLIDPTHIGRQPHQAQLGYTSKGGGKMLEAAKRISIKWDVPIEEVLEEMKSQK